jgi:hypothetical protein
MELDQYVVFSSSHSLLHRNVQGIQATGLKKGTTEAANQ